jgi:hypothetical protein
MSKRNLPIRLPRDDEEGIEFINWLDNRLGSDRLARQRLVPFIEEWDLLRDEVLERERREPTLSEYAARWNVAESSAYRLLSEYRQVFASEDDPGPLCELLWDGMPRLGGPGPQVFGSLMAVKVIDA